MNAGPSRRAMLAAGGAALVAGPALAAAYDPRSSAEGQVKLGAALDEAPAWWTYSGVVYAVRPQARPLAILAVAGCQASRARRLPDGAYRIGGAIMTFFRDPTTGAFLERFANPLTGAVCDVAPNVLTGGALIYPADGSSARADGQVKAAAVAPGGFRPSDPRAPLGRVEWSLSPHSVILNTDRAWNVVRQPQLEAQTQWADRSAFFDPAVRRLPAQFSATTLAPWMAWMGMGDAPGHLVWHTYGEKVFAIEEVAADYRAYAGDRLGLLRDPPAP